MRGPARFWVPVACVAVVALLAGCGLRQSPPSGGFDPQPTRGYILISIDTLRADHLGAYGYDRDTSPFLDSLAASGTLFERAVVQYPSTLTSHMSIFTGLYPQEHEVLPPSTVLSGEIETLPEIFQRHGFRTAGHTEGGFMAGGYGFARGFDEFTDTAYGSDTDVERTFRRGLDSLQSLEADEPFFLFLHTYAVH
ncbi:MAG: sulfatase-like hydrolase/transferase, partial [Thermoanaerobaculia bacterium]